MKKLGIIGGAGPLASALLYETLIQESYARKCSIPEIVLINYPFTRGLSLEESKENEKAIHKELNYCIQILKESGVELGILACNTLHLFLNQYSRLSIQFCHLPEIVIQAAREKKHHRLLILGTQNTCRSHLYQLAGIQAIYPSLQDQEALDAIIDRVLEGKILKQDSLLASQTIERALQRNDFDGVVLGCTDFPVLHHRFPIRSVKPIYDSIKIPAKTLVGCLCNS
jgi:aspartate racemase